MRYIDHFFTHYHIVSQKFYTMSVSTLAVGNNNGYTTSDLSIGRKCQTARMPVPNSDVFDAEDGEFMMKAGERPQYWYAGQWNPMASLFDIPDSPIVFSTGTLYLRSNETLPPNDLFHLTTFSEDSIVDMDYSAEFLAPRYSGYYNITIQATFQGLNAYFGIDTRLFIYAQTGSGEYLMNTGWFKGQQDFEYFSMNTSAVRYIEAGTRVLFYVWFEPSSTTSDIYVYGGDPQLPENIGLCTYLQVTWQGPAPASMLKKKAQVIPPVVPGVLPFVSPAPVPVVQPSESVKSAELSHDIIEISTDHSDRCDNVDTSEGTSEWEMA